MTSNTASSFFVRFAEQSKQFPWFRTGLITGVIVCSLSAVVLSGVQLRIETQKYIKCLPFDYYLTQATSLESDTLDFGDLVYLSGDFSPTHFPDNTEILKMVGAQSGDAISREGDAFFINGQLAGHLTDAYDAFVADGDTYIIPDGKVWLIASSAQAVDSRYFGPVNVAQLLGRGYALF